MDRAGKIASGIVLAALVFGMGCQARDYNERIGPYEVNFMLPDNIASEISPNETVISNVIADGFSYDVYKIELQTPGSDQTENNLLITHFNKTNIRNIEAIKGSAKLNGITCDYVHQTIDGHDGAIDKCYERERSNGDYRFMYQLDNETIVNGALSLDWDTIVLPFLNSLHIKDVE